MAKGENARLYREHSRRQFQRKIAHTTEEIDKCIDKALGELTDYFMNANACMRKKQTVGNTRLGGSVWFDRECREKKKSLRKPLARFPKTGEQSDKLAYNCSRKEYKQFIEAMKRDFGSSQVKSLLSTENDPQAFWKEIRKHRGRKVVTNDISGTDWRDHFEKVLNAGVNGFRTFSCFGPHIWNSLPQDLRHFSTLSSFKAKLKTSLFSQYFHPN